jgi:hypothetical protein
MWQPTWHVQKIADPNSDRVFSEVTPPHESFSFKYVNDGVLFAVMVDAGLR